MLRSRRRRLALPRTRAPSWAGHPLGHGLSRGCRRRKDRAGGPWGSWSFNRALWSGLMPSVVWRFHHPLLSSKTFWLWVLVSFYCLPASPYHSAVLMPLVFWVRQKKREMLCQAPCGKVLRSSTTLTVSLERNLREGHCPWQWAVPPWGRGVTGELRVFLPCICYRIFPSSGVPELRWTLWLPQRYSLICECSLLPFCEGDDRRKLLFCHLCAIPLQEKFF